MAACGAGSSDSGKSVSTASTGENPGATTTGTAVSAAGTSDLCHNLTTLKNDVQSLASAVTTLDKSNIDEAANTVQTDVNSVKNSRDATKTSNRDEIGDALTDVKTAISKVGQGGGAVATVSAIQTSIKTLGGTIENAFSQSGCA